MGYLSLDGLVHGADALAVALVGDGRGVRDGRAAAELGRDGGEPVAIAGDGVGVVVARLVDAAGAVQRGSDRSQGEPAHPRRDGAAQEVSEHRGPRQSSTPG